MDQQTSPEKIAAIVPAYNESSRIGAVLSTLVLSGLFAEIIVVDDGSTDDTESIVQTFPVTYIKNDTNKGKGFSMNRGVLATDADTIFFVDADVKGLSHVILNHILLPVLNGSTEMSIGMRNRKIYYMHQILWFVPLFGGERALTRNLWKKVPDFYKHRFRIEAGLNFYAVHYGKGFTFSVHKGMNQVIKEKKYGFWNGFVARLKMFYEIMTAQFRLHVVDMPSVLKKKRKKALWALQSLAGLLLGMAFLVAAYIGPAQFLRWMFQKELVEDPNPYIIHFFLRVAENVTLGIIVFVGVILVIVHASTLAYTARHLPHFISGFLYKRKVYKED
ncbi:MAG: Glycosyltransferase involved in cell wall biogenesis [Candidatus Magasanikbacteria bacterium GW2011_GWD2_43_18]|nr:MAG: Glycosyltransferase involved in cell wall biogenesis [Candidatus Magasanikbacteria bacterium GW2011_GWD2_43_18]HCC13347.1 hypothetical protein [Candidatus Magasanikbacteria bacterium]